MNCQPFLKRIASVVRRHRLEDVLVGNAAAALQGAPVTTLDFDFMFRETPGNIGKLKKLARDLGAVILKPFYPASSLFRVVNEDAGLQVDFMPILHGIRSFESLRSRATTVKFGNDSLLVADLADIVRSKRSANRPRDRAVLGILEATLREKAKSK